MVPLIVVKEDIMDKLNIVTHNGKFHADEVMATAIIISFVGDGREYEVHRVDHQTPLEELKELAGHDGYICDIGKTYDEDSKLFDHHQFTKEEEIRSSAGMVLDYFKDVGSLYVSLKPIIDIIDANDIGVRISKSYELPAIISCYNNKDIYSDEQYGCFMEAVKVCMTIVKSYIIDEANKVMAKEMLSDSESLEGIEKVLVSCEGYIPKWGDAIHDMPEMDGYEVLVWEDEEKGTWNASTISKEKDVYGPRGVFLTHVEPLPEGMVFIHKGEFYAVSESLDAMSNYLHQHVFNKDGIV